MGFIKGLAGIQQELAKRPAAQSFEDVPKATWLSIKANESVKLVFLQELDEGSPNYLESNGVGIFALQHANPNNWKKTAKCTADEGECYGCSQGWRSKVLLYINVLVDNGTDEPYVAIWSRALGKGSVAQSLLDMAADEDFDNSVTDKTFKFSRTGSTKDDTTYSLNPTPKPHGLDLSKYELYDLEKYVFTVSPERQEAYYLDGQAPAPEEKKQPVSASSIDADW